jgi:hypothetical protein
MPYAPTDLRSLARAHTEMALRTLAGIASNGANESARVAAAVHLLDRGWGKAPQTHTGEDGEGAITILIRHIVETAVEPRALDGRASPRALDQRKNDGDDQ